MRSSLLVALGDSHLEGLQQADNWGLLRAEARFCIVPGATAVGLRNPNSLTDAVNIFRDFVATLPRDACLLVHLGEVDCGFVIWWRSQQLGESVQKQFEESLAAYRGFLDYLRALGFHRICLTGASLPTIKDGAYLGRVANLRREVRASLAERTELTLRYNQALHRMAMEFGYRFFDIADGVLNVAKGIACEHFLNSDPANHHLDPQKVAGIWAMACNSVIGHSHD